jgi:hypothetical protein
VHQVSRHLRGNAVAYLALFVALGGSSYAATNLPKNSVGSKQIKKNAVTSSKVKNGSLLARDFKAGQLPAGARGLQGPQGAKGDIGPSNAYYQHGNTLTGLPAGDYVVNGELHGDNSANAAAGSVTGLQALGVGTGDSTPSPSQSPTSQATFPAGSTATIPFQAIIHLPHGGLIAATYTSIGVATQVDFTAIRVGSATP